LIKLTKQNLGIVKTNLIVVDTLRAELITDFGGVEINHIT